MTEDRRRERHAARRDEIVAAAWVVARRDGLAVTSLRAVAEAVDLRQPSLYAYFESKLALYDAMFTDGYEQMLARARALPPEADPREAVIQFAEFCVGFAAEDPVRHELLFQRTIPGFRPSPAARRLASEFTKIGHARLAGIGVTELDRNQQYGMIYTGIVAGFTQLQVFNDPHGDSWVKLMRRAMEMYLDEVERAHDLMHPDPGAKRRQRSGRN